jgi:hypothetical protein
MIHLMLPEEQEYIIRICGDRTQIPVDAGISLTVHWLGYRLDEGTGVRCPEPDRGKHFSLLESVQAGSGAHPASYTADTG